MRLIDADELIVQFRRAIETFLPNDPRRHMNLGDSLKCHGWEQGLMVIQEAPTIQPSPHWIPVTEATPTEDDDYWCTFDAETGRFVDWCSWYQGRWVVWTDDTVSEVRNVIAWMPLPEPYKGVTE